MAGIVQEQSRLNPGQVKVAATGFLSLFSLIGIMFYGLPFFYDYWVKEFGWSRATVTSGFAFGKVIVSCFGFFAGWFIDRFGPRRLMLAGILIGGGGVMVLSTTTELWQFYFFYILIAMGYLFGGPLPNQVLTSRWFNKSRGKAMGIAYIGVGVGGMFAPQIAKKLTLEYDWHQSMLFMGLLMILVAFPVAWFVKENPEGYSRQPENTEPQIQLSTIFKSKPFWLLLVGSMCSIGAVSATSQNLKLFFSLDLKYSQQEAANVISLVLLSSIIGRLMIGWLADRMPKKYVMILISIVIASAIPLLYFPFSPGIIYLFAFLFGIGLGGDYMIIPLMSAELFGLRTMGRVMGIILTADGLAEAFAPMLVGRLRDLYGSYANGFASLIVLAFISIIAISMIPNKRMVKE